MRGVLSLVLATQAKGKLRSQTAQGAIARIDHVPVATDRRRFGENGLHSKTPSGALKPRSGGGWARKGRKCKGAIIALQTAR